MNSVDGCRGLISHLHEGGDSISLTIREVISRGWNNEFLKQLDEYLVNKEDEIKSTCETHHDQCRDGVNEITSTRDEVYELTIKIQDILNEVSTANRNLDLIEKENKDLQKCKVNLQNADSVIQIMEKLIGLINKAERQISSGRHFPAVKSIDSIRELISSSAISDGDLNISNNNNNNNNGIGRSNSNKGDRGMISLSIIKKVNAWIPSAIERIRNDVYEKFEFWLNKVHGNLNGLGKKCMRDAMIKNNALKKQAEADAIFESLQSKSQNEGSDHEDNNEDDDFEKMLNKEKSAKNTASSNKNKSKDKEKDIATTTAISGNKKASPTSSREPSPTPDERTSLKARPKQELDEKIKLKFNVPKNETPAIASEKKNKAGEANVKMVNITEPNSKTNSVMNSSTPTKNNESKNNKNNVISSKDLNNIKDTSNRKSTKPNDIFAENLESLDLSPLYACLHIHQHLSQKSYFVGKYRHVRMSMIESIAAEFKNVSVDTFSKVYADILYKVCGFFILEAFLITSNVGLLSINENAKMWDRIMDSISVTVYSYIKTITNTKTLLDFKDTVMIFAEALDISSDAHLSQYFSAIPILSMVHAAHLQFLEISASGVQQSLSEILSREPYDTMIINDANEFQTIVKECGLMPDDLIGTRIRYPITMPFSSTVPQCIDVLKELIYQCQTFGKLRLTNSIGGSSNQAATLTQIKAVAGVIDNAFVGLNGQLLLLLEKSGERSIAQAGQVSVNSQYLAKASLYLEDLLWSVYKPYSNTRQTRKDELNPGMLAPSSNSNINSLPISQIELKGRAQLLTTSQHMQGLIFEFVSIKIEELIENFEGEWEPKEAYGEVRDYARVIVDYLQVTFMCLTYLPSTVREAVHFIAFKHIGRKMTELLLDPTEAPRVNYFALKDLREDVRHIDELATRCPISGLLECMSELRQLLDMLTSDDVEQVLNDKYRESKYPHVQAQTLYDVCVKIRDIPGVTSSMFSKMMGRTPLAGVASATEKVTNKIKENTVDKIGNAITGKEVNVYKPPALTKILADRIAKHMYAELN